MKKGDKQEMTTLKVTREAAAKVSFTVKAIRKKTGNNKFTASELIDQLIKDLYMDAVRDMGGIEIKEDDEENEE